MAQICSAASAGLPTLAHGPTTHGLSGTTSIALFERLSQNCFLSLLCIKEAASHPVAKVASNPNLETTMFRKFALAVLAVGCSIAVAHADDVEIKALNMGKSGMMVMEPAFVRIAPGDKVHFVATDKGHNFATIPGVLPEGATPFEGKMNESVTVTFDKPGVYGVHCHPHYAMGMVALVVVGDPTNEDAVKAMPQPGKAKAVFAKLFDALDAQKTAAK
jgi:pseudoazurin